MVPCSSKCRRQSSEIENKDVFKMERREHVLRTNKSECFYNLVPGLRETQV